MQEGNCSNQDFKMLIDDGRRNQGMVVQDKDGLHTDLILSELQFIGSFLICDSSSSLCLLKAHTHSVMAGQALLPRLGKTRR